MSLFKTSAAQCPLMSGQSKQVVYNLGVAMDEFG